MLSNSKKNPSYFRQIIVIEEKPENKLFCYIFYSSKYFLRKILKSVKGIVVHILLIEMFIKHLAIKLCLLFLCMIGSKISSNHGLLSGGAVFLFNSPHDLKSLT